MTTAVDIAIDMYIIVKAERLSILGVSSKWLVSRSLCLTHRAGRKCHPHTITLLSYRLYDAGLCQADRLAPYFFIYLSMNHNIRITDTSIQANLRRQALNKKASHRNWREWDAMYDFEVNEKEVTKKELAQLRYYMPRFAAGMVCFGVALGLFLSMFIIYYV